MVEKGEKYQEKYFKIRGKSKENKEANNKLSKEIEDFKKEKETIVGDISRANMEA